jgi:deoxynucleoside triphosphate triphosphohydrolase SAMHD1
MSKIIFDPIHKYMEFEPILLQIIDTSEFQRLRNIKQLGACYYVFPGAKHNRFEHSLGVCHLSGLLVTKLQKDQPELKITDREVTLIKIAGLVHDIGHACFSHFFDNNFLKDKINNNFNDHEYRSGYIFEYIVDKYDIKITKEEIGLIKSLINPGVNDDGFLYQIVANKESGLDCDKFDYISRDTYNVGLSYSFDSSRLIKYAKVIDDKICFPLKCNYHILDLYHTRYKLFKQVYTHPCVRSIEYMILDLFNLSNDRLKLTENITDVDKFIMLTDSIVDIINYSGTEKEKKIIDDIRRRNIYKLIGEITKINLNKFKLYLKENSIEDKVIIDEVVLNYSMNNKNPMNKIHFYKNNKIVENNNIGILPDVFEEIFYRVYSRDSSVNFKIYGFFDRK